MRTDAEGTFFIVGFMQNDENRSPCAIRRGREASRQHLRIASRFSTSVSVILPNGDTLRRSLSPLVPVGFDFSGPDLECLGEGVFNKGIRVLSERPVSLYCLSSYGHSTDGYLALPVAAWGTLYTAACFESDADVPETPPGNIDSCEAEPRRGEFAVIAAKDDTRVTILPAAKTASGGEAGAPMTRILNRGEIWQVQDAGTAGSDLTTSRITADKPVGVLSGHERAGIPEGTATGSHLIEMPAPIAAADYTRWATGQIAVDPDRLVFIPPFAGKDGGTVRIINGRNGATEYYPPPFASQRLSLPAGTFAEMPVTEPLIVWSARSASVSVAHYSRSGNDDPQNSFRPFMILPASRDRFARVGTIQTMPNGEPDSITGFRQFEQHFATIIAEKNGSETMKLNGVPLLRHQWKIASGEFPDLGSHGQYIWITLRLPDGGAFAVTGDALFGGYVYGVGRHDSYGWPIAGSYEAERPDTLPPTFTVTFDRDKKIFSVIAREERPFDSGLDSIHFGDAEGEEYVWGIVDTLSAGERFVSMVLGCLETQAIRIVAKDRVGNADTLVLLKNTVAPVLSDTLIEIGKVGKGEKITRKITLSNPSDRGSLFIDIEPMSPESPFDVRDADGNIPGHFLLPPGGTSELFVPFRAEEPAHAADGVYKSFLYVSTGCDFYHVRLKGSVRAPVASLTAGSFGKVMIGDTVCREVVVKSVGEEPLIVSGINVTAGFSTDPRTVPPLPDTLQPGDSLVFVLCFHPDMAQLYSGGLVLYSNDWDREVRYGGSGYGIDAVASVTGGDREETESGSRISAVVRGRRITLSGEVDRLSVERFRLYSATGEEIGIVEEQRSGNARQLILSDDLPGGAYYLRIDRRGGAPITVGIVVVR